ncbi:hypothetical protein BCV72DRAFT_24942 [Rhizopus microsporus var. microsporus]|uniref:Uncharacterized protein n=1 Tax=Rhizopus microsporus var. microsporus TaxID=86635 RepID=A0A1X0QVU6_RHIZD|nr:hypothetical protein BCV72DRAFT_24942 [Rhizopus microsporus var. microsporus]
MQQKLIDLRKKQKALQHMLKSDIDHFATLNARNEDLRRDVDRMKQKQKILNEVELLKAQEPLIKYSEVNKQLEDLKRQVEEQKATVRKVNAEYAPLQELLKEHENELKKIIAKNADEAKDCNGYAQELKDLLVKIKTIKDGIDARKADIKAIEKRIPEKEQKVRSMTNRINELEETLKEPPSNDTSEIEANIVSQFTHTQLNEYLYHCRRALIEKYPNREIKAMKYKVKLESWQ